MSNKKDNKVVETGERIAEAGKSIRELGGLAGASCCNPALKVVMVTVGVTAAVVGTATEVTGQIVKQAGKS